MQNRKTEIVLSIAFLLLFLGLLFWATGAGQVLTWGDAIVRLAFAILIALAVRWLMLILGNSTPIGDIYRSNGDELRECIKKAKKRVWILQTWLPATDGDARLIVKSAANDKRIILGSYRFEKDHPELSSAMHARPRTRGIDSKQAKAFSATSFKPLTRKESSAIVKFNPVHHPGWIAVIDREVFWGQTPLNDDNWSVEEVCHRAPRNERRASYWIDQFLFLWEGNDDDGNPWCHDFDEERNYNEDLRNATLAYVNGTPPSKGGRPGI